MSDYFCLPCEDAFVFDRRLIFRQFAAVEGSTLFLLSKDGYVDERRDEYACLDCFNAFVVGANLIFRSFAAVKGTTLLLSAADYVKRFGPDIMRDNKTMDELYVMQRREVQRLVACARAVMKNNFFQTLDRSAVQKWERTLELDSYSGADLQTRRDLILQKRRLRIPFTKLNLMELCEAQWGKGGFDINIDYDNFIVWIDINTNYPRVYFKFKGYVRSIIPANMAMYMVVQYTYAYFNRRLTYGAMSSDPALTYGEISKYRDVDDYSVAGYVS